MVGRFSETLRDFLMLVFILAPLFYGYYLNSEMFLISFGIVLGYLFLNQTVIGIHEFMKYKRVNNPYNAAKRKRKTLKRILLGLVAGFHYTFFIGTYSHKKYNTQVWYPETLECVFGNVSQALIFNLYFLLTMSIVNFFGIYYAISLSAILIIVNIISIFIGKRRK